MVNNHLPDGTIVWKMGNMWGLLPPDQNGEYHSENVQHTGVRPIGMIDNSHGSGSFKNSLQVIGTPPKHLDVTIKLGWVNAHLSMFNGHIFATVDNASETASKRWAMGIPSRRHNPFYRRNFYDAIPSEENIQIETTDLTPDNLVATQHAKQVRNMATWEWLRSEVYIRDRGVCWVCNKFVTLKDYELGHLVDRCNGGADSIDNCAVMHKHCNIRKPSHYSLEEALKWRLTHNPH